MVLENKIILQANDMELVIWVLSSVHQRKKRTEYRSSLRIAISVRRQRYSFGFSSLIALTATSCPLPSEHLTTWPFAPFQRISRISKRSSRRTLFFIIKKRRGGNRIICRRWGLGLLHDVMKLKFSFANSMRICETLNQYDIRCRDTIELAVILAALRGLE